MIEPPFPLDETTRLMSLHSLRILDTAPEERFDRITRMAQRLFGVEICLISLVDSNRQWFKSKQGLGACETERGISFCGHAIHDEKVFLVCDASKDPRFLDNPLVTGDPSIRFYAGCPIRGPHGHRIGTLCLIDSNARTMTVEQQETLRDLAAMVEDELMLVSQSTIDDLTKVSNRRGFHNIARHMLSLCRRVKTPAELMFFDLDGFKHINDTLGHEAGDAILKRFAKLLTKCFRSADVVARLGGDEFVVLMAGADIESDAALDRLKKLCDEDCPDHMCNIAWSSGRVVFDPKRHTTVENLLADADAQMYKNKVRNRTATG
ncbi:MAG: sensor domain-containing diguanylate cyclase [Woeseiaceae bacterium]|nr:sensor domain-containing diguanylate cyclase [Woeseiaceae bacterium]